MDGAAGPQDILQDVKCKKAQSLDWALWLYEEPSCPSQSSGPFSPDNAKLLALSVSVPLAELGVFNRQKAKLLAF